MTVSTTDLEPGTVVATKDTGRTDFGLPLVAPTRGTVRCTWRTVRNHVRARGGTVVWFDDGTKSEPIHGRTVWMVQS